MLTEIGVHSFKIREMIKGKAFAYSLIVDEYKEKFGEQLTEGQYKYAMLGYAEGIKTGIDSMEIVRVKYIGSFQPSRNRVSIQRTKKKLERVASFNNSPYICGEKEEMNSFLFKPNYYGTLNRTTTTESTREENS